MVAQAFLMLLQLSQSTIVSFVWLLPSLSGLDKSLPGIAEKLASLAGKLAVLAKKLARLASFSKKAWKNPNVFLHNHKKRADLHKRRTGIAQIGSRVSENLENILALFRIASHHPAISIATHKVAYDNAYVENENFAEMCAPE